MPLYEYHCENCGPFTAHRHFDEEEPEEMLCPQCGEPVSRVFNCPSIHFHADGFTRPRIDPFRTRAGQRPNYGLMEERAMENAERERKAGLRED